MQTSEVLVLLTDEWADWEVAYAIPRLHSASPPALRQYAVKTIAMDRAPKMSMGGIRAEIDYTVDDYHAFDNMAMLILPGGFGWQEGRHDRIAEFVQEMIDRQIPVAAICGATIFLGKHGFLDNVKHTGDDLQYFLEDAGYNGQDYYISAQVAVDKGIITANETAAIEFARAIFVMLQLYDDETLESWYDYFKGGMVR